MNLDEIRARARSAARYGREGFFVTSLLEVAEEDVPALLAEVERLRAELAAVKSLTVSTDGDPIDHDAEIPVGEIVRVLADAHGGAR